MGVCFCFPLAIASSVSFVEVSLSILIALKACSLLSLSNCCKSLGFIFASVAMHAIIVAIFGAIMPEPFAIPTI